jgi:hypothetical protein
MTDQPEPEYSLVMPFVVCASKGGPYEDQAFVAGYQAGLLDKALSVMAAVGSGELTSTVATPLVPQLDLVAMKHGFRMQAEPAGDAEGWSFVKFGRSEVAE